MKLKGKKTLLVSSYYMPHRNMSDVNELRKSLELATNDKEKQMIIAGDFNCPDIDWQSLSLRSNAQDKEVQQAILDLSIDFNLTQVIDKPTREKNILDLLFTNNPSLIKSTANAPGISDHDIVVADSDTKPYYSKKKPRRCFLFSKANWELLSTNISDISKKITQPYTNWSSIHILWDTFKSDLTSAIHTHIPSKMKS